MSTADSWVRIRIVGPGENTFSCSAVTEDDGARVLISGVVVPVVWLRLLPQTLCSSPTLVAT